MYSKRYHCSINLNKIDIVCGYKRFIYILEVLFNVSYRPIFERKYLK